MHALYVVTIEEAGITVVITPGMYLPTERNRRLDLPIFLGNFSYLTLVNNEILLPRSCNIA